MSQQKSILSYFSKISTNKSPSPNVTSPAQNLVSTPMTLTPKTSKSKPSSSNSRNGTASSSKRRASVSDTSLEQNTSHTPKRIKTEGLPSRRPFKEKSARRNEIRNDDDYSPESIVDSASGSESDDDCSEEDTIDSGDECETSPESPKSKRAKFKTRKTERPISNSKSDRRKSFTKKVNSFTFHDSSPSAGSPRLIAKDLAEGGRWAHLKLTWLNEDNIADKFRRRPNHPDYDQKTLYVPKDYLDKLTPAIRQWWEMKINHFDTLLFFKVGKFYELYHMDAVIVVQELGITFMKGDYAHCGFPEIAYSQNAEVLVGKGYKVARCEQTETPAMMDARIKKTTKATKFDKVIRREICQVTTKGIRLASAMDARTMPFSQNSEYLYAIVERNNGGSGGEYGVCFIDTTIGTFFIGQFKDDRHCSRLRTLFSHHLPIQILYEKGKMSSMLNALVNNMAGVRKDALIPETEFWNPQKTLKFLAEGNYFRENETSNMEWPSSFNMFLSKNDSLGLTPAEGWELGTKCLGGVVSYLHSCLVEHDILTLRRFETYSPLDLFETKTGVDSNELVPRTKYMVLDGSTLRNLEVTEGSKSLLSILDNCSTTFGKRFLRYWVCVPLATVEEISKRLDSVEELMRLSDIITKVVPMMKSLLDLERLLGKIHTLGSAFRSKEHPDSRASLYEEKRYSKRKIMDLTSVLKNFKTCIHIIDTLKNAEIQINSDLLVSVISDFPSFDNLLKYFDEAFDHEAAIQAGKIQPVRGVLKEYDEAFLTVENVQRETEIYLKEIRKKLNNSKIVYFGSDKKRFQLEVPENMKLGDEFELSSNRKGFRRYVTNETKALLAKIIAAEANRENVVKDITRRVFAQFDESRELWAKGVKCISTLDALISLAKFSKSQENMCRPRVVSSSIPFINIVDGRHPCVDQGKYIPNSCSLGYEGTGSFLLLTGANMGGKSTTMKQTGLIAILAHMGCYVPATSCDMSVINRIFTRIGAADNISEGESTFFVELSETSAILQHSSRDSLILMDELGRGTATYDGNAIAYSVARALSQRGARTIFSTHYHGLVSALKDEPTIQIGHMACMVEREDEKDDDPTQETITFLYKLTSGPCAKSYGFNAARLAGIPDDVIRLAHRKAKELEEQVNKLALCRKLLGKIRIGCLSTDDTKLIGFRRMEITA